MKKAELVTRFKALGLIRAESLNGIGGDGLIDAAISGSVAEFSLASPRVATKTDVWDGETGIALDGWYEDSAIITVECPSGGVPPDYLGSDRFYVDVYDKKIYLIDTEAGQTARIRYGALHTIPATEDISIPDSRLHAFLYLVAARLCEALAARHAEEHKAFSSDVTDHSSKSREYASLAKDFRKQFRMLVGASDPATPVAAEARAEYGADHRVFS